MNRLTSFFTELMRKYLPDPFVFAIVLTWLTLILAIVFEHQNPIDMTTAWGKGFWSLLAFGMQMTVILAMGAVLATTPQVDRMLNWLVRKVHTPHMAIIVATLIGGIGSYLNWGFGLIVGGVMARKLAMSVKGVHYPLIIASAYSGFCLYGLGLSATIPMTISTAGHPLEKQIGIVPLAQTIFSPWMLGTALVVLIILPLLNASMHPKDPLRIVEINREQHMKKDAIAAAEIGGRTIGGKKNNGKFRGTSTALMDKDETAATEIADRTIGDKMNNSKILGVSIALLGMLYVVLYFMDQGQMDLNIINFFILFLGLLLLRTPAAYVKNLSENIHTVSGIVLQFPFYAGIMALMAASGLVASIAHGFLAVSSTQTLGVWGLLSSFVINFFAPSAGGHWVIQGPFMADAAVALHAPMGQMAMSVQLGNSWNDLIQPFWILPALALSKLKLKDIMGYTVVDMIVVGFVYIGVTVLWGQFA